MDAYFTILLIISLFLSIELITTGRNKIKFFEPWLSQKYKDNHKGGEKMDLVWTIVIILVILWFLGQLGSIGGNLIHILLVIAVIIIVYRLAQGKNMLTGK
jgi:hypothetical protein